MWGRDIRVVVVPSVLAFAFLGPSTQLYCSPASSDFLPLAIWIASTVSAMCFVQDKFSSPAWSSVLAATALAASTTVNAVVTGLIVFKLFKVFQEVKAAASDEQILGTTGGSTLRAIMFVLIESAMPLFFIQLARFVATTISRNNLDSADKVIYLIDHAHNMLNVISSSDIFTYHFQVTDHVPD